MMKSEFENLAGREVTDEQYKAIETLYMSSNLEKAEFVKSIKAMLKSIPKPEKKKDRTEYETCNVKTGTCTSCDQYKNRTEAYKTDEQRYSEEQDAIDRETKKKLREMEQEEKMQKLPSTAPEEIKTIRVSQDKFEEYTGEYRKPYMITKDDGFKVGNVVKLVVFAAGKATGETADMRITCKDDDITCSGLSDGWCVIGLGEA